MKASGVDMSGVLAPSRTAMPTLVVAKAVRLPGTRVPAFSNLSIAGAPMISTSVVSPAIEPLLQCADGAEARGRAHGPRFAQNASPSGPTTVVHRTRAHDLELCHLFPHAVRH